MVNRVACVLVLAAACGDDPVTSAGDSSSGNSSGATTTTSPPIPTTGMSTSGDDASGTGSATATSSDSATPTTSPVSSDTSTGTDPTLPGTSTTDSSDASTAADTGTSTADTTTDISETTDNSTTGGCQSPGECPLPPGECVVATCEAGLCGAGPAPLGTPCQTGVCDDDGACVDCNLDADCPGEVCVDNECTAPPPSCMDGFKNGSETAVDCGGSCPGCDDGAPCLIHGDCLSDLCSNNTCTPQPTCSDNQKNGDETDTDCGGPTCAGCPNGDTCIVNADCQSALCTNGTCTAQPNCMDNQKNGGETDIDCGGGTCPDCPDGDACLVDADCLSDTCDNNTCGQALPACTQMPPDPATGQRCPLFMDCTQSSECGVFQGCQQWFCNNAKTCELNALVNCWQDVGGQCNAEVVFTQQTLPPVAKRFVPPDGVDFREVASLVFTVKNNSANDLYLDKLPLLLDVMGGGSKFDVSSVKIFDNSGGSEHGGGDLLVCLTADPFSFPANGTMGPCAGSAFSRVPKGASNQFLINVAFAANKTFIAGRSYRLRLPSTAGIQFKVGFNGPLFVGTMCGVPNEGLTGAWVTAQNP